MKKYFLKAIRRNYGILEKYYLEFLEKNEIKLPDDHIKYFKMFIYIANLNNVVFMPELIAGYFVHQYIYSMGINWPVDGKILSSEEFLNYLTIKICTFLSITEWRLLLGSTRVRSCFLHFRKKKTDIEFKV